MRKARTADKVTVYMLVAELQHLCYHMESEVCIGCRKISDVQRVVTLVERLSMVPCPALWPLTRPWWAPAVGHYATHVFHNGPTFAHCGVDAAATVVPVTTGLLIESRCHPLWARARIHGGTVV